jgi:predicted RNase H-like HicB family nuclease
MPVRYLRSAMGHAHYEMLLDQNEYYGEISDCNGVNATAKTLEDCRNQLEEVLEEWILFRVYRNLPLPIIDGIELSVKEAG